MVFLRRRLYGSQGLTKAARRWKQPETVLRQPKAREIVDHSSCLIAGGRVHNPPDGLVLRIGNQCLCEHRGGITARHLNRNLIIDIEEAHLLACRTVFRLYRGKYVGRRKSE